MNSARQSWDWIRRRQRARQRAEQEWVEAPLKEPIVSEALSVASQAVDRELASFEALGNRLLATVAFAGALLTLAITLGQKASVMFPHHHDRRMIFEGGFVAALVFLVLAVLVGIRALRPAPRHRTNPDLLKHYGIHGAESDEVNADTYRREVALVVQLDDSNKRRVRGLLRAQWLVALALILAAILAVIVLLA
jgi:hypothetical protein